MADQPPAPASSQAAEPENNAPVAAPPAPKAVFRVPGIAMLAVALLLICIVPAAFAAPGLQLLLLIPLALAFWIVRMRTTATGEGLTVRTLFAKRELAWSQLKGLALSERGTVRAVTTGDEQIALPSVRTRHLPVLSLVSDGRVGDPSGVADEMRATREQHSARSGE
jgi:hypothetical protein